MKVDIINKMITPGLSQKMRMQYEGDRDHFEDMVEEKRSNCGDYHFKVPKRKGATQTYRRRNRTTLLRETAL
jgi:hypothetical protein